MRIEIDQKCGVYYGSGMDGSSKSKEEPTKIEEPEKDDLPGS